MNVRIGNDIRLNLTLKGPRDYTFTNIKRIGAYFVNKTLNQYMEPWDPSCNCCNRCGCCGYHHNPHNIYVSCNPCGKCFKGHWCWRADGNIPFNPAFGQAPLRPNYGHPFHCHDFAKWCEGPHCGMHGCASMGCHMKGDYRYLSDVKMLPQVNKVQVYFPAYEQFACGTYDLVVVMDVYESGWDQDNIHTYTSQYNNVFTLVDGEDGISGSVTIDVDTDSIAKDGVAKLGFAPVAPLHQYGYDNTDQSIDDVEYPQEITYGGASEVNIDSDEFITVSDGVNTYNINNTHEGWFLWFATPSKITSISSGSMVMPLTEPEFNSATNMYYYACPNPIGDTSTIGGLNITINK